MSEVSATHLFFSQALVPASQIACVKWAASVPLKAGRLKAIRECLPFIDETAECLDIGTGHGGMAAFYATQGNWTFVEKVQERVDTARRFLRGSFECRDALEYLTTTTRKFHFISCVETIMCIPDTPRVLAELDRILLPGGSILLTGRSDTNQHALIRWRRRLKIEGALGKICDPSDTELSAHFKSRGYQVAASTLYFGPVSQIFQTLLDLYSLRPGTGDRVTRDWSQNPRGFLDFLGRNALRVASALSAAVDGVIFPRTRFAYVLVVKKAGGVGPQSGV